MSSSNSENSVTQPEDSNRGNINRNSSIRMLLRSPNLGDYFRTNDDIRNKGCIDEIKS